MHSVLKRTLYILNPLDRYVSGEKAHAVILKMIATLLVLQLIRVKKMADTELLQSLFHLTDHPEPRQEAIFALHFLYFSA